MNKKFFKKNNKKIPCVYCGEAPVNHSILYTENLILSAIESHMVSVTKYAPRFLKDFAGFIPIVLFNGLIKLKLGKFSSDIEKANSFRSRIIWEEAIKRGIHMEQVILGEKPLDWYRAQINGKNIYFESIPIQPEFLDFKKDWDNKIILKKELSKHDIPVPQFIKLKVPSSSNLEKVFSLFEGPVIIKPQLGSRGRHTVTNIRTFPDFKKALSVARQISPYLVVEEHLAGYICRATVVGNELVGFYRASVPEVYGDGKKTIRDLIKEKNGTRPARESIHFDLELYDHIARAGFLLDDVLPKDVSLQLSHRCGRLFGGMTTEMIDEVHPSFIPILEKAARVVELPVVGFDCIIPDPTKDQAEQKWGIIECNTLPFIDMHYFALVGKPRNIAGMIWDMWK